MKYSEDDIRAVYDRWQWDKRRRRDAVRAEVEARVAAEQWKADEELSTVLRTAHASGLSKVALRRATRQYGGGVFARLWHGPEELDSVAGGVELDSVDKNREWFTFAKNSKSNSVDVVLTPEAVGKKVGSHLVVRPESIGTFADPGWPVEGLVWELDWVDNFNYTGWDVKNPGGETGLSSQVVYHRMKNGEALRVLAARAAEALGLKEEDHEG